MAQRRPLAVVSGSIREIPTGDTVVDAVLAGDGIAAAAKIPAAGKWFFPLGQRSATTQSFANGVLRVQSWVLPVDMSLGTLGAEVSTAGLAGGVFRIGVWADSGFLYPGLLIATATVVADATGVKTATITPTAMPRGLYWLGGASQGVGASPPTLRALPVNTAEAPYSYGSDSVPPNNETYTGMAITGITTEFGTSFPAGAALTSGLCPRLIMRVSV